MLETLEKGVGQFALVTLAVLGLMHIGRWLMPAVFDFLRFNLTQIGKFIVWFRRWRTALWPPSPRLGMDKTI